MQVILHPSRPLGATLGTAPARRFMPSSPPPGTAARPGLALSDRLDAALLALASGRRRPLLELARDVPGVVAEMARQFSMSPAAVSHDLSMLHAGEYEERTEALTAAYDRPLLAAASIGPGEAVLDVGCGSGGFTCELAGATGAGRVVGIDVAAPLVARARRRRGAGDAAGVSFVEGDASVHPLDADSFDVVVSRFGAMYFGHPVPAFANLARALRPGGRLALVAWRDLGANEWMSAVGEALAGGRPVAERPSGDAGAFALAAEETVRSVLGAAGFEDVALEAADEPVAFGADAGEAFDFVSTLDLARRVLEGLDAGGRRAALDRLRAVLAAHETAAGVRFGSGVWVVTARRP